MSDTKAVYSQQFTESISISQGVTSCDRGMFSDNMFWFTVLAVAIVALINLAVSLPGSQSSWYKSLEQPEWMASYGLIVFISLIMYLVLIFVFYRYMQRCASDPCTMKNASLFMFAILMLQIVYVWAFFQQHSLSTASLVGILSIFVCIWFLSYMWCVDQTASVLFIVYIIWLVALFFANVSSKDNGGLLGAVSNNITGIVKDIVNGYQSGISPAVDGVIGQGTAVLNNIGMQTTGLLPTTNATQAQGLIGALTGGLSGFISKGKSRKPKP